MNSGKTVLMDVDPVEMIFAVYVNITDSTAYQTKMTSDSLGLGIRFSSGVTEIYTRNTLS